MRAASTALVLWWVTVLALWPHRAAALGLRYPDHVAAAVGVNDVSAPVLRSPPTRWSIEFSERDLFDDVGLRVSGARAGFRFGAWQLGLEASSLSAAVGREVGAAVTVAFAPGDWMVALSIDHDASDIAGAAVSRLTAAGLHTGVTVARRVRLRCGVDGFRVAGIERGGADIESSATVEAVDGLAVTSALVVDRVSGAHTRVSAALRLFDVAVLAAGYDDANASLSVAAVVFAGGARAAAGVSAHPVLGLSRGVSVGWSR